MLFRSIRPGQPVGLSNGIGLGRPAGPKDVPSKMPIVKMEKKISAPADRNLLPVHTKHPLQRCTHLIQDST